MDGGEGLFVVSTQSNFFFMCIWCSDLSKCLTLNLFYQCHQLALLTTCTVCVGMVSKWDLNWETRYLLYFIVYFKLPDNMLLGSFEMSCMSCAWMQSQLVSRFESCFEFASSFVCFVVFLLDACSNFFFFFLTFNVYLPTNKPHFYYKNKVIS